MRLQAAIAGILVLTVLTTSVPAQQSDEAPDWWLPPGVEVSGPSQFDRAWNLRVPITLSAGASGIAAGTPVQLHMDLGEEALQAGWVQRGGKPASFTLDSDSIRVVRYTTNWADIEDPGRLPTAVNVHEGWLEPDQEPAYGRTQQNRFHPQANALVTLEWIMEDDIAPFHQAYYYVYFDVKENSDKSSGSYPTAAQAPLEGMYWVGSGTRLFGHHPGSDTLAPTLTILGTLPDTEVTVYTYPGVSTFPVKDDRGLVSNPSGSNHPFTLGAGDSQAWTLGLSATDFMIEATKPVIALTHSGQGGGDFVPSVAGGLSGLDFILPPGTQSVQLIAPRLDPGDPNEHAEFTTVGFNDQSGCNGQVYPGDTQYWCVLTATQQRPEIHITNGHPVLVQYNPVAAQATWGQAPSIHGSPIGTTFLASTLTSEAGGLVLASPAGATVDVQDRSVPAWRQYEDDLALPAGPSIAISGQGWVSQAAPGGPTPPLTVTSVDSGRFTVRFGAQEQDAPSPQTTPFGGRNGMEFLVQAPFVVHAYYDGTVIEDLALETFSAQDEPLSATEAFTVEAGGVGTLRTNKPVSVFPMGDPGTYRRHTSAQPQFKVPAIQDGEYRGYLIDVRPTKGDGSVFIEALPGETVEIPFLVQNLGQWDNAPLADSIGLTATTEPSNWAGTPSFKPGNTIFLEDATSKLAHVTLPIPKDSDVNTQVTVQVEGRSQGNPNMMGTFSAVVFLRQNFDVEIWFGDPGSSSGQPVLFESFQPGQTRNISMVVKNAGTGTDTFDLFTQGLQGGWNIEYLHEGIPIQEVGPLDGGESQALDMLVTAPQTMEFADVVATTTAQSEGLETARDQIRLFASLSLGRNINMTVDEPIIQARPGETARFVVDLENGQEGLTVALDLVDTLPDGWSAEIFGPQQISLSPDQTERLFVDVTVPTDAAANTLATTLIRAEGASDRDRDLRISSALTVEVLEVHELTVQGPPALQTDPGSLIHIELNITNDGNADQTMDVLPILPGGWNATAPPSLHVPANESRTITVGINVPGAALAGTVPIEIAIEARGLTETHPIDVHVQEHHDIAWAAAPAFTARPGETITAHASLTNHGNTAETLDLQAHGTSNPPSLDPQQIEIPAGATRATAWTWTVPLDAAGNVSFTIQAASADVDAELPIEVEVIAPTLRLEHLIEPEQPPAVGEVAYLTAILRNPTNTTAKDVRVQLVTEDRLVDGVEFESVGPNGTIVAPLRWVRQAGEPAPQLTWGTVQGDQFATMGVHALTEPQEDTETQREAPGLAWGGILALLASLAYSRSRRQPEADT